jgi:hypothetical protein
MSVNGARRRIPGRPRRARFATPHLVHVYVLRSDPSFNKAVVLQPSHSGAITSAACQFHPPWPPRSSRRKGLVTTDMFAPRKPARIR